jgi:hypothetical protein
MSDEAPKTKVKWWNWRLLIRSVLVAVNLFGAVGLPTAILNRSTCHSTSKS